jgi:hypothetical protein
MNERIKELAEQAGLKVNPDGEIGPAFFGSVDAGYRKFAELIVQECLMACSKANEIRYPVPPTKGQVVVSCMREIEQHFGV